MVEVSVEAVFFYRSPQLCVVVNQVLVSANIKPSQTDRNDI